MNIPEEAADRFRPDQHLMGDGVSFFDMSAAEREAFAAGDVWARTETINDALSAVINADAYADAVGDFNGRPVVTAETKRHIDAIRALAEGTQS